MGNVEYKKFIEKKTHLKKHSGFKYIFMPDFLYDFQKYLIEWSILRGRAAIFADCGLGKTPMQLVWAENIARKENKRVLILTPLAVSLQTVREGEKFGIECYRSINGKLKGKIIVTNYEKIQYFNSKDFIGVVCDESSILKNYNGARRGLITEFMKKIPYRLLCTATAAPNDYTELGTSSEALSVMGYIDMLNRFYKNTQSNCALKSHYRKNGEQAPHWMFKKHAENHFWRWVASWAKAIRKPSDIGFSNDGFNLPRLIEKETIIKCSRPLAGRLFVEPAFTLQEQRAERRATIQERCETVAAKLNSNSIAIAWCHLNDEGDLLERLIPDSKQVKGGMSDDKKEAILSDFSAGNIRVLITKPKISGFGLNWQHCSHMSFFPSHSYEQYYQGVRRCWRFGQKNEVVVDIITTEGEFRVLKNLQRKAEKADKMFTKLIKFMNKSLHINTDLNYNKPMEVPVWL
ncbi:MAG: helicase [Candidatus Aenigmatarchaeota archaeon]|nr:MAG: helicase [Candidatus Aenigmarchaeota archaeon]